jgi:hypothetical protein
MTSTATPSSPDAKQLLARRHRAAMRRRTQRIRRTVLSGALAIFTAAFVGISVQLASGHDPALSAAASRRASTTASSTQASENSTESTTGASATEASSGEASTESSTGSGENTSTPSAVTTSQS